MSEEKIVYVQVAPQKTHYGLPAFLSLLVPGLGQIIKGHLFSGVFGFIFTVVGYFFLIIPGMLFHLAVIYDAYNSKQ